MALIALLIMHSKYAGSLVWTRGVFSLVDWSTAGLAGWAGRKARYVWNHHIIPAPFPFVFNIHTSNVHGRKSGDTYPFA